LNRRIIVTERLRLAPITVADSDRLALFHADARVMSLLKHGVLSRSQSDAMVADYEAEWAALGFGSWTVSERAGHRFVGLAGLRVHDGPFGVLLRAAFTPDAQGKGYGPETGRAALAFAFDVAGLDKVCALTRPENIPGQRGLEKFGMKRERTWIQEDGRELILYVARNPNRA
jgi:RimJ/RimL family protein N-acetyltransferase